MKNNLDNIYTEEQLGQFGEQLARGLKLKKDKEHPDRWQTAWGTKTNLGLIRMVECMIENLRGGDKGALV